MSKQACAQAQLRAVAHSELQARIGGRVGSLSTYVEAAEATGNAAAALRLWAMRRRRRGFEAMGGAAACD